GLLRFANGVITTYTQDQGLSSNVVKRILEDRAGNIWVGTEKGLNLIAAGMSTAHALEGALSESSIRDLAEDREGNIWVGTDTTGLYRLKAGRLFVYAKEQGLPNEVVVPITEDAEGSLWIGLNCGGLVRFRDGKFTPYIFKGGLSIDCVWSLCAAPDGTLWIGTWGSGLTRLKDGNRFTYTTSNSGLSSNVVLSIYQDRQGTLWVGTSAGLNRLRDGEFTVYRRADGLVSDDVRFITEDSEGALWVGTAGGASRFKDGVFTNYTVAEGLSHNFVRAIHVDEDRTVWLGTYNGGLNRFKDGRFTHYRRADGLFDDVVSRILEDGHGNFWMTGNRGIYRVSRQQLNDFAEGRIDSITSLSFGVADGMKSQECNGGGQPAGWRTRDGRLWFPTIKGVVMIDPRSLNENRVPPPVVIERVLANKNPVDHRAGIEVPPGRGDLEIEYTCLSFVAPEKVRFKYRLDGYDEDWIEAGARRVAYYTNIPPGKYRFQVIASNNDGVWNTEGVGLDVRIIPPFWRRWWFLTLAILFVAGLAVLVYERRVSQLKKAHRAQEAFSRQLIESQERERKRIAAELHDSLGQSLAIIKNRAALSLSQRENTERALEQLEEISAAASHVLDEVKEIVYNLRPYQLDRLGLTKAIQLMLKKVFASNGIRCHFEIDRIDHLFSKEEEINVYRIVQESVNNIVRHAEATEARVIIKRYERQVEIAVEDNGKGFVTETASRGFGLTGMAERARMLGGSSSIDSALDKGTRIKFRFNLKEDRDGN
ncbi:MAG: two-component regulator propeller domain-containing protein, partial [Acidobacteriota bacterium]